MFKDAIKRMIEKGKIVPFNKQIAEGVGYTQAKDGIHGRVDTILRRELNYSSDNPKLPEGLSYLGYVFLSPFETYIYRLHGQIVNVIKDAVGLWSLQQTRTWFLACSKFPAIIHQRLGRCSYSLFGGVD